MPKNAASLNASGAAWGDEGRRQFVPFAGVQDGGALVHWREAKEVP